MSIKRKLVWLPYDMDTAIGINNEGSLVFSYNLEDTDHLAGGADIFNGQASVIWNNIRMAFGPELREMYRTLRSTGALSYPKVEKMFEDHQAKWSEAIFNEDAWYKYLAPLIEDGNGAYLSMMQGSKAEQRKWWLYNRFRYIDSKYNAGDALSDLIQIRGYARSNVTVIPYADIYPTVKYGSYLVSQRGQRLVPTTLVCPLDEVNDTEIYIYSSSQLASVGDLSGFKVGFADFSMATRLQEIKLGDADEEYSNPNLGSLTFGNNVLLKKVDVRNCIGLGDTTMEGHTQTSVDLSHCPILEEVYFDNTKVAGVTLPNGGVVKKLHLPGTITNLTILNQNEITEFVVPTYANISTLRLENTPTIDSKAILNAINAGGRVRLIGFYWEAANATEIEALLDKLDTMRGLDENGNNTETAQVSGTIHTGSLTGAQIASYNARYPYLTVTADHTSAVLSFYNGSTLITTQTVLDGGNGSYSGSTPTKAQDAQYTYTFSGWSKDTNDNTVDSDALNNVIADRDVYACFTGTIRKYTVTYVKASADGGGTLYTIDNVNYGTTITAASSYNGSTPTTTQGSATDYPFEGWNPSSATVTGNTTFTAKFGSPVEVKEITDSWATLIANVNNGTYADKYKKGNYISLDVGSEGTHNAQILDVNADVDANGNTIPLTFVLMGCLPTTMQMNSSSTATGGYSASAGRSYLLNTIYPKLPAEVKAAIVSAVKYSSTYENSAVVKDGQYTTDPIWLLSTKEVFNDTTYETKGPSYTAVLKDSSSRIRNRSGSANYWWLRSVISSASFRCVSNDGGSSNSNASNRRGVVFGFCVGRTS